MPVERKATCHGCTLTFFFAHLHRSIKNPELFWDEIAKQFYWETQSPRDKFFSYNFDLNEGDVYIKWMEGATTNISFNLLDKNVKSGLEDKIAFYW